MKPRKFRFHPVASVLAGVLSTGFPVSPVQAYELVWVGSGDSDSWFYSNNNLFDPNSNWTNNDAVPTAGDSLVFDGNTRLTPFNDELPGFVVGGISFSPGAGVFQLNGNAVTTTGNITNLSANLQTVNMPINVGADQSWDGGAAGMVINGAVTLGNYSLALRNKTAINNSNADFVVGDSGAASMVLQSGSMLSNQTGFVGNQATGQGSVTVNGANSLWENSSELFVGNNGNGSLNIENGGKVSDNNGIIAFSNINTGTVTVTGPNSLWANSGSVDIGAYGNGTLNVQGGGHVISAFGFLGHFGTGTATITGADSLWANNDDLNVGIAGNGTLNIENGGKVSNSSGYLGKSQSGTGVATVKGTNSLWANSGDLSVGLNGNGMLNIENGGKVSVGNRLSIGNQGILNLNGGTLSVNTPVNNSPSGQFNWTVGTVNITGSNGASLGTTALLGTVTNLTAGKILDVSNTLTVNAGNFLLLNGGQVKAGILDLSGGSIAANPTTSLNMSGIGKLNGYGSVAAAITGGNATNVIQANGGSLTLGNLNSNTGFDYGGKLDVGSNQVALLDKDKAHLGAATSIADGGKLSTVNGADLGTGETLSYTGNAGILGNFTNNGQIAGSGGTLTFLNNVNGAGGFNGDIAFHGDYNPGNSPAAIDFHGGNISFNASSVLTLEIFGNTPGSQYDQLLNIDHFNFNGTLALVFGGNFTPAGGSSFNLFDFTSFSGSFAEDHITVTGIDRALLDFSKLSGNGSLRVAAVPLPAVTWLFLSGWMLLLAAGARRKV